MTKNELYELLSNLPSPSWEVSRIVATTMFGWRRITPSMARKIQLRGGSHGLWVSPGELGVPDGLHGTEYHRDPPHYTEDFNAVWNEFIKEYQAVKMETTFTGRLFSVKLTTAYSSSGPRTGSTMAIAFLKAWIGLEE